MLFFYLMWDNESQRLGKKRCTPVGYALHGVAELLGLLGFLLLLGVTGYLVYKGVTGSFQSTMLKLLLVPLGMGIVSEVLYRFSWKLVIDRGFEYDFDNRIASWVENGRCVTCQWPSYGDDQRSATDSNLGAAFTSIMTDEQWEEIRVAMHSLGELRPQWRTRDIETGHLSQWDGDWYHHFGDAPYEYIEWLEIRIDSPEQEYAVLGRLKPIGVAGERIDTGFRIYGFVEADRDLQCL